MKSTIPMQSTIGTHACGFCFSDRLEEEAGFVWDGSHLLQEIQPDGRYIYIYTNLDSYDPLAQVRDWTTEDREGIQQAHYFHCDQIGITNDITTRQRQHRKSARLVGNEQSRVLEDNLSESKARGYEQGCIGKYKTLTGERVDRKGVLSDKDYFNPDKPETRGNRCRFFVRNKTRDKKQQANMKYWRKMS